MLGIHREEKMQTLHKWAVRGMAAYADYGSAIFVVGVMAALAAKYLVWWEVFLSGFLQLIPDSDMVLPLLRDDYKEMTQHHSTLMHRPLLILPLSGIVAYMIGGAFWAVATLICVSLHYFHDKSPIGDSDLYLLWPLPRRWTGYEDSPQYEGHQWLKDRWIRPSRFALTELTVGSIGLLIGLSVTLGWEVAVGFVMLCWVGFILVWNTPEQYTRW